MSTTAATPSYIKGFTPDTFGPYKQVTGYQVLAMILRAVGYDENNEYTGDQLGPSVWLPLPVSRACWTI